MDNLKLILAVGETIAVEFKRCGNGVGMDTYETVCSFLNRFGGDIYLGVADDGEVIGLPPNTVQDIVINFVTMISNPDILFPTVYLSPETIEYEGKQIIKIHVPPSSEVHSFKKVIYDRVADADVKVTATGQIAQMYIRKHKIYTEKRVYPYVKDEHLRLDRLPRIRQMAINRHHNHPWKDMTDAELLQSARLYTMDAETGKMGYNLAAIMLLGLDHIIKDACPAYRTDALLRKINVDRYDDRRIVETNLIDSYEQLMEFAEKHLWDKFYLEGDARISLRNAIAREMLVNTLMHREFTSSYIAQFVIEKDKMTVSNASRAEKRDPLTPGNFVPNPKNPIIASFFRNIGLADELGSGMRNLYKYTPRYSGKPPEIVDRDIFRIVVPLDDSYSFDVEANKAHLKHNGNDDCALTEKSILEFLKENPRATQVEIANAVGKTRRGVQEAIARLREQGLLCREGARKNGRWVVHSTIE